MEFIGECRTLTETKEELQEPKKTRDANGNTSVTLPLYLPGIACVANILSYTKYSREAPNGLITHSFSNRVD